MRLCLSIIACFRACGLPAQFCKLRDGGKINILVCKKEFILGFIVVFKANKGHPRTGGLPSQRLSVRVYTKVSTQFDLSFVH